MTVQVVTRGRHEMATGARVRPRDIREDKYLLARTLPPLRAVDLSQPRSLTKAPDGSDPRAPVGYQGGIGSCASWATSSAAYTARKMAGGTPVQLHAGWLYEQVRRTEGTWPQDVGSYLATNADRASIGLVKASEYRYVDDARFDYPSNLDSMGTEDYVLSHLPFYPDKRNPSAFLEQVWTALDRGLPVVFGSYWPSQWYSAPADGMVTKQIAINGTEGGHAYMGWGITPGYLLCRNSWDTWWTPTARQFGMQPGDFAIPWEAVPQVMFEARAISPEAVVIPKPEPIPPAPTPKTHIEFQRWRYVGRPGEEWEITALYKDDIVVTDQMWLHMVASDAAGNQQHSEFMALVPASKEGDA